MNILITGPPGIGKTTLTKKVAEKLKQKSTKVKGFYTQEVRDDKGNRKGFDIIDICDESLRKPLAIADAPHAVKGPKVGKYTVMIQDFEFVAMQSMSNTDCDILIIDEIGKMEMLSKRFSAQLSKIPQTSSQESQILATIPCKIPPGPLATLVDLLKSKPNTKVIEITKANRDQVLSEILSTFGL